jgi:hypothetical protein
MCEENSEMNDSRSGRGGLRMPRSRGAVSGLLLIILGVWGALVPFIGPYFHFAYTPGQTWAWTSARGWLEVFPGVTAAVGGFLLLTSRNRAIAMFGSWLAVIAGAWFVVGRTLASPLRIGDIGHPIAATDAKRAVIEIASLSGLGTLIVFLGAAALARISVRTVRDVEYARQAELSPAMDNFDAFADPSNTEALTPATEGHRRDSGGLFHRGRAGAAH